MRTYLLLVLLVLVAAVAWGLPTPRKTTLQWDDYTDPDATGFFLYWVKEQPQPRVYLDAQRVDLGLDTDETVLVVSALPMSKGRMCFRLTAYDAAGNESDFSNEACGFFGVGPPANLRVIP